MKKDALFMELEAAPMLISVKMQDGSLYDHYVVKPIKYSREKQPEHLM